MLLLNNAELMKKRCNDTFKEPVNLFNLVICLEYDPQHREKVDDAYNTTARCVWMVKHQLDTYSVVHIHKKMPFIMLIHNSMKKVTEELRLSSG